MSHLRLRGGWHARRTNFIYLSWNPKKILKILVVSLQLQHNIHLHPTQSRPLKRPSADQEKKDDRRPGVKLGFLSLKPKLVDRQVVGYPLRKVPSSPKLAKLNQSLGS